MGRLFKLSCFALLLLAAGVKAQDAVPEPVSLYTPTEMVETVEPHFMLLNEENIIPSDEMYPTWANSVVHYNSAMPDSFRIDLRNYVMPTPSVKVTDIFGYRPNRRRVHQGLDIKVQTGDTIYAAFDGKVRFASYQRRGYGNYLVIRHHNGLETLYAHLSKKLVEENAVVKAGDPIGLGGNTGRSTGSHLHFETRLLGKALDPALMFDFPNQDVTGDSYTFTKPKQKVFDPSDPTTYYKVRSGDTLSRIAAKMGTSVKQLCKLNGITTKSTLRIGQVLRLY